ncbi:MAG: phosphopantothenoylcysteine decarboxylase [Planctomycetes bacterium]|nr:phosphopantothenoylcysteine decarboxylase [Planctomycetota bacterium]
MPANPPEIVLGVTGGIAAYKAAELASRLMQDGARVTAVLTKAAERFIGATTFEALTGRPVHRDLFEPREHFQGEHIGLARRAHLLVVAPASADFLAKAACGLADDLLSTLVLAVTCPVLMAPAMNSEMWAKPAVQRNVARLREDGIAIIEPGSGWLSCGQTGPGRMAEPSVILARIHQTLAEWPPVEPPA